MTFYQGTNGRTAVLLPGASYSPNHPVLYHVRQVLLHQGWSVEEVWWNLEDRASDEAVISRVKSVLNAVADKNPLVVGKSLGSLALPQVVQREWPAIWLTPVLNRPQLIIALKNVSSKTLLVGGTADGLWNGDIARASGQQVFEIPDANHDLEISGDPLASIRVLSELVATITLFVESL
ncbi:MAG: alpha/beta hydrolase [Actinobacteria bacterium]|nr:alpha/beta hydrolase [Actinomycetota bacterium]